LDIGVYDLIKTRKEYPPAKLHQWRNAKTEGWLTVPDAPDIGREFKVKMEIDTIRYSKKLMREYYDPNNPHHLPVMQGRFNKPDTVLEYCKWFKKRFTDNPERIAVGTLCRSNHKWIAVDTLGMVRAQFPDAWIHAFGLRVNYLDELDGIIDSFDSTAWTYPRGRGGHSARNKKEKIEYFREYLKRIDYYESK
jgi:hypothetical protein